MTTYPSICGEQIEVGVVVHVEERDAPAPPGPRRVAVGQLLERGTELQSREVIELATELAQLMVNEVLDWRVVFKDRPPVLPA